MEITAYSLAERWVGTKEVPGAASNPFVLGMLQLDQAWPAGDDVPWCSAFLNFICWQLRLPRSKHLSARSWLRVGTPLPLADARPGFDVVVLKRGTGPGASPQVTPNADGTWPPGHVGLFGQYEVSAGRVYLLGGNQGDTVSIEDFPATSVLGVRRLL